MRNIKYLLSLLFGMLFITSAYSQIKVYKLVDKTEHADIDSKKFDQLNKLGSGYHLLNKVFTPAKGTYTVYRFIANFKGQSHRTEKMETFHDVVILKTDKRNTIIKAYQYTLEWSEIPFTVDLYEMSSKIKFYDKLKISALNFKQVKDGSTEQKKLIDNGYLKL